MPLGRRFARARRAALWLRALVVAANPAQVQQYRAGKTKLLGFFVGQVMKATRGKANPQVVNELLKKHLK